MESLAWRLEKRFTLNVYQFTLPGHAYKEACTHKDWIRSVDEKIEELIKMGYSKIYVVGHSMGGVLAAYAASKYPQVKKVVLAAPAFKYIGDKNHFSIKKATSIVRDYGLPEIIFRGLERLPMNAINEFMTLVNKLQETPTKISAPILILQGLKDDIAPRESSEYVFNSDKKRKKSLVYLEKSNHDLFNGPQKDEINIKIEKFLLFGKTKGEKETIW